MEKSNHSKVVDLKIWPYFELYYIISVCYFQNNKCVISFYFHTANVQP